MPGKKMPYEPETCRNKAGAAICKRVDFFGFENSWSNASAETRSVPDETETSPI